MNKRNRRFKVFTAALVMMSCIGLTGIMQVSANNHGDAPFNFYYNGDGGDRSVPARPKTDATSVYLYNTNSGCTLLATVWSTNKAGSSFSKLQDCSVSSYTPVSVGQAKYLPSWVYEWGYEFCTVTLTPNIHSSCYLIGKWSPDSI